MMIDYSIANAPLQKELSAGKKEKKISITLRLCLLFSPDSNLLWKTNETDEVGNTAAFLASPLASAITGAVIYVDNGLNAMGVGIDSPIFNELDIPKEK